MARISVNGSIPYIAATYRATTNISALSNAASAVATLGAGHGTVVGEYLEILSSGWSKAVGRVFRVSAVSTNDVTLEGFDTSSTSNYPAGQGTGTARVAQTWAQLQQINEIDITGGEQQFEEGQYIDNPLKFRYPTNKSAIDISFMVDDDQSLSYWTQIKASQAALSNSAFRLTDASGIPRVVCTGIWTYSAGPEAKINNVLKRTINVAAAAALTEYTS